MAALGKMGLHAKKAVPPLIKAFEDEEGLGETIIWALSRIRPDLRIAAPVFIRGLKNEDSWVRGAAYDALVDSRYWCPDECLVNTVIYPLIEALRHKKSYVRQEAANVLRRVGQPVVPHLVEAIKKEEKLNVSTIDIEILGRISKPAVPALARALKLEDLPETTNVPTKLGPVIVKDLLTLIEAINADSESERTLAINTLDRIGFDIMVALPNLIEVLKDDDILSNTEAAYTLGNIGKPAIPILIEVIRNNRGRVRRSAACALGYIGPNAKAAVPAPVEALMDEDLLSSMQITYTLAKIKHGAGAALPTLIAKLKDMRNDLCRSAASKRLLEDQRYRAIRSQPS